MSRFTFAPAVRTKTKARVGLIGPTGSGKTLTALYIARGLAGPDGRIAVIDSENGKAALYAGEVQFDHLALDSFSPVTYVEAIEAAEQEGYDVIVLDSLSHAWMGRDGALEQVDRTAKRYQGNSFAAWREVTPKHNELVDKLVRCKAHLVATMRAKTEYVLEDDGRGKKVPRKVGMAPIQRDGMEYEFDVVADMDQEHNLIVSKTRYSGLDNAVLNKPSVELGERLRAWLEEGVDAPPPSSKPTPQPAQSRPQPRQTESIGEDEHGNAFRGWFKACGDKGLSRDEAKELLRLTDWKMRFAHNPDARMHDSTKDVTLKVLKLATGKARQSSEADLRASLKSLREEYAITCPPDDGPDDVPESVPA